MLLLLGDGTRVQVTSDASPEVPASQASAALDASPEVPGPVASGAFGFPEVQVPDTGPSAASDPEPGGAAGGVAGFLTRFGPAAADQPWAWRAVILAPPPVRPVPAGLDQLALPALVLDAGPAPAVAGSEEVAGAEPLDTAAWTHPGVVGAVERLLGRLGGGPGWAGIAPGAPPR